MHLFLKKKYLTLIVAGSVLVASGCATTQGPVIRKEDINAETKLLEVKAFKYDMEQMRKINQTGLELIRQIPQEDIKVKPRPYIGLYVLPIHRITNRMFDQKPEKGVYIGEVLDDTPVAKAGLKKGDILLAINDKEIENIQTVLKMMKKAIKHDELEVDDTIELHIIRDGQEMAVPVVIASLPIDVSFVIMSDETVNAMATANQIFVTHGLLNFIKSDDELAAVMAHELSHIVRGHIKRKRAGMVVNSIFAISLGATAEVFVPGLGDLVHMGTHAAGDAMVGRRFSRDLEREADYYGVRYYYQAGYDPEVMIDFHERFAIELPATLVASYLNTHPTSAERKVRVRTIFEELEKESE